MPPMSTTHYGTAFSIPGANTSGAPMPTPFTTETHGLSYTPGFTPSGGQPSGPPLAPAKPQQQNYRNNGMGNSAASSGTYGAGAAGSSPPRTMPEIDWVSTTYPIPVPDSLPPFPCLVQFAFQQQSSPLDATGECDVDTADLTFARTSGISYSAQPRCRPT
jgi:hypothetical protein